MRKIISVLIFTTAISAAMAQEDDPYASLIVTSPEIEAAEADENAVEAQLRAARGQRLPQIRLEAQAGSIEETIRLNAITAEISGSRNPNSAAAVIEQPLFTSGRLSGSINAAAAQHDAASAQTDAVRQDILLAGLTATADLVRDRDVLRVRTENEVLAEDRLSETYARREAGLATITDVKQAEARAAQARANRIAAEAGVSRSEAAYERLFGAPPPPGLTMPQRAAIRFDSVNEAMVEALQNNPDLSAARQLENAARYGVREARGARLPQIGLEARAAYAEDQRIGELLGEAEQYSLLVTGRMALWSGGSADARIDAARSRAAAASSRQRALERRIRENVIARLSDIRAAEAALESRTEQVSAAREAQTGILKEFDVGQRTRLDVLDADLELADAEVARVTAQRDLVISEYALLRIAGLLTLQ